MPNVPRGGGTGKHNGDTSPTRSFKDASVEECQDHFDNMRSNGKTATRRYSRRVKEIDVEDEFQITMNIIHRDLERYLDISNERRLTGNEGDTVTQYAKLLNTLRKQFIEAVSNMDTEELKKIADEDNENSS